MKRYILGIIILGSFLHVTAQEKPAEYNNWVFGIESGTGICDITNDFNSLTLNYWSLGIKIDHMFKPNVGIGSGIYYSKNSPYVNQKNSPVSIFSSSQELRVNRADYLNIPITAVLRPKFNKIKGGLGFVFNGGLLLNLPLNEEGVKRDYSFNLPVAEVPMDGGVYYEPRIYLTANPGLIYGLTHKMGMEMKVNFTVNPGADIYNTDFLYTYFLGMSIAFVSY